ncbi:hydroxyacid dehydrogenase, partial [bacterium]|nr:hydroxyacid dehydrogenase [bacterium]
MYKAILDTYPRPLDRIFTPEDLERLYQLVDITWGKDEPMPEEELQAAKAEASFIIGCNPSKIGGIRKDEAPNLKAIMEVGGMHPGAKVLDYKTSFRRGIRVLSCAPAFAPQVAEQALGLALAVNRKIVSTDRA